MVMTPLSIDTTPGSVLPPNIKPNPEFLLIQPSPQITGLHSPAPPTPCLPIQEDIHDDDDFYLPLVLEHRPSTAIAAAVAAEMDPCLPGGDGDNSSATTQEQLYELDTVIPLITELGFMNQDKDKKS